MVFAVRVGVRMQKRGGTKELRYEQALISHTSRWQRRCFLPTFFSELPRSDQRTARDSVPYPIYDMISALELCPVSHAPSRTLRLTSPHHVPKSYCT